LRRRSAKRVNTPDGARLWAYGPQRTSLFSSPSALSSSSTGSALRAGSGAAGTGGGSGYEVDRVPLLIVPPSLKLLPADQNPYFRCNASVSQCSCESPRMATVICCQLHARRRLGSLRFFFIAVNTERACPSGRKAGFLSSKTTTTCPFETSHFGLGAGLIQAASRFLKSWYVKRRGHGSCSRSAGQVVRGGTYSQ